MMASADDVKLMAIWVLVSLKWSFRGARFRALSMATTESLTGLGSYTMQAGTQAGSVAIRPGAQGRQGPSTGSGAAAIAPGQVWREPKCGDRTT